jgi:hypothetical protein
VILRRRTVLRSLTIAEARALRIILAPGPDREIDRIRASGLPRRTYQVIRRRAVVSGWVEDRFVPDCPGFGWPLASFSVVRPYLEQLEQVRDLWMDDPSTVLLWATPEILFRVAFTSDRPRLEGEYREAYQLTVDCRTPGMSVYFDFERSFSRWTRLGGGVSAPDPLPGAYRHRRARKPRAYTNLEYERAREICFRAETSRVGDRGPSSPSPVPRNSRDLFLLGALKHRVFPKFQEFPPFGGQSVRRLTLAHGRLLRTERSDDLYYALAEVAKISPFLFVCDGRDVMIGVLSAGVQPLARGPVLDTLRDFLTNIEVTRLETGALNSPVSHRYSTLFRPR